MTELEFLWIQNDTVCTYQNQVVYDSPPVLLEIFIPNDHIIDTLTLSGNVCYEIVIALVVAISSCLESLRCCTVPVSSLLDDEGSEMPIFFS